MKLRYHFPPDLGKLKWDLISDIDGILKTRQYTGGKYSKGFADEIVRLTGYEYAIPMGSATQAIFMLARWYWKAGFRKVRVPAFTWPSSYKPWEWLGFRVNFVDINPETWLADFGDTAFDTDEIGFPVDTFGSVYPSDGFESVDSAQSLGARWNPDVPNRVVSLSGSKIITSGEGGILLTQLKELNDFALTHNWLSRMSEMNAVLGLAHLAKLNEILEKKQAVADAYRKTFPQVQWQSIPISTNNYIVAGLVDAPMNVILQNPDVEFRRYYDTIINETNQRTPMADVDGLPNTKSVASRILAFPSWSEMPMERIAEMKV